MALQVPLRGTSALANGAGSTRTRTFNGKNGIVGNGLLHQALVAAGLMTNGSLVEILGL